MDKWCVIVVRSDHTTVEVLPFLYNYPEEALQAAQWDLTRWRDVSLEVVKIFVPLTGEKVSPK